MNWEDLSIGEILKKTREQKGISLDEVASSTNISKKFLRALEENDFEALPGKIHITGFIRLYGSFLDLDESKLMEKLNKQEMIEKEAPLDEIIQLSKSVKEGKKRINPYPFIFIGFVFILGVLIFLYSTSGQTAEGDAPAKTEDVSVLGKKMNIKKGESFSIPTEDEPIRFKLAQISGELINLLPEEGNNNFFVKENEYLRYDFNNDLFFDYEIVVDDIKESYAVLTIHKIREPRLPDQEKYSTGLRSDIKANQAYNQVKMELKNKSKALVLLWVVQDGKERSERIDEGKSLNLNLIEDGRLKIQRIEISDFSALDMKIGDRPLTFEKAFGAVGYLEFAMEEKNGVKKLNWKSEY
jgi:transcriptional regulator with XRE-family HTH domain